MKISIIGTGYVGLVTGACLAEVGHSVVCTDSMESKIQMLQAGQLPIYEPHLDTLVARNRAAGRLCFTAAIPEAVHAGDVIFISVNTPAQENGEADLSAIDRVARLIATEARAPKLVIEKSTVPAQTGQALRRALSLYGKNSGVSFRVASNPEFLREGHAVRDFLHPDRIVVGVEEEESERQLRDIYQPLREGKFLCPIHPSACPPVEPAPFVVTTINSAELIKHAANSFLALKISYANVIADLCERLNANVDEVLYGVGLDPRIGVSYFRPGLGYGGSCLSKDTRTFIRLAEKAGVDFALLRDVQRINELRIVQFVERMRRALWVLQEKQIAVLGLAFKPDTDDIRFAPALELIRRLLQESARVRAYDPKAMEKARAELPDITYATDSYAAAQDADAVVIATEWPEFRELDWERIRNSMARPLVFDGRNLLDPPQMKALGFEYHSVGRPD